MFKYVSDVSILSHNIIKEYVKNKNVTDKEYKRISMNDIESLPDVSDISNAIEITKNDLDNITVFDTRKDVVEKIISKIIEEEKFIVNINLEGIEIEEKYLERFIVELKPRLKEIGANIVITNNRILSDKFLEENI